MRKVARHSTSELHWVMKDHWPSANAGRFAPNTVECGAGGDHLASGPGFWTGDLAAAVTHNLAAYDDEGWLGALPLPKSGDPRALAECFQTLMIAGAGLRSWCTRRAWDRVMA